MATPASRAQELITGRGSATTPRRLRVARLALTLLSGLLMAGGIATSAALTERQQQADAHAAGYVRAESIQSDLLRAYGASASSVVQTSPEAADSLYDTSVGARTQAAWSLLQITEAGTDNADVLAAISSSLVRFGNALERASSQRGTDAARASLSEAYEVLTTDLLPHLASVQAGHSQVSADAVPWWMWLLPILAWLTAAAILAVSWYVARVSHRVVNLGLASALVAVVAVATYSGSALIDAGANGIGTQFARAQALSAYRVSAMSGYAHLANGVATRTWASSDTAELAALFDRATANLDSDRDLTQLAEALAAAASAAADAAEGKNWTTAEQALANPGTDAVNGLAARLAETVDANLNDAMNDVHAAVAAQTGRSAQFGVIAALAALAAGLGAAAGLHQRLKEYR